LQTILFNIIKYFSDSSCFEESECSGVFVGAAFVRLISRFRSFLIAIVYFPIVQKVIVGSFPVTPSSRSRGFWVIPKGISRGFNDHSSSIALQWLTAFEEACQSSAWLGRHS